MCMCNLNYMCNVMLFRVSNVYYKHHYFCHYCMYKLFNKNLYTVNLCNRFYLAYVHIPRVVIVVMTTLTYPLIKSIAMQM